MPSHGNSLAFKGKPRVLNISSSQCHGNTMHIYSYSNDTPRGPRPKAAPLVPCIALEYMGMVLACPSLAKLLHQCMIWLSRPINCESRTSRNLAGWFNWLDVVIVLSTCSDTFIFQHIGGGAISLSALRIMRLRENSH